MTPAAYLAALALLTIAGAALMMRRQVLELEQGELVPGLSLANMAEELGQVLGGGAAQLGDQAARNVAAFLAMIRRAEGTEGPDDGPG